MLLDEPFAGADADGVDGIVEALRTVQRPRSRRDPGRPQRRPGRVGSSTASCCSTEGRVRFDGDPAECLASDEMRAVYFGVEEEPRCRMSSERRRTCDVPTGGRPPCAGVVHDRAAAGSVTALVGPNGAGKSSALLGRSTARWPRAGTVVVDGDDVVRACADRAGPCRASRSCPQGRQLFAHLTVAREPPGHGRDAEAAALRGGRGARPLPDPARALAQPRRRAQRRRAADAGASPGRCMGDAAGPAARRDDDRARPDDRPAARRDVPSAVRRGCRRRARRAGDRTARPMRSTGVTC